VIHYIRERHLSNRWSILVGLLLCQFFMLIPAAHGQRSGGGGTGSTGNIELRMNEVDNNFCDHLSLMVTVFDDSKARLDRESVAKLHDQKRDSTVWQTLPKDSEPRICIVDFGDYDLEVSAVGYLTEHKDLHVNGTIQTVKVEVILHKDPTAVNLSAADDAIPKNARKDAKRAVDALKSANYKEAQSRLDKVYKVAPSSAQINFLYGYLFMQLKNLDKAEAYLSRAASLDPRRVQTLTLLGRVQLQREHYEDARKTLEQAVGANSQDWIAHNLLADAYLRQKEYEKAREQAQLAIDEGKSAASAAQLTLGQALANVGRDQEGLQALNTFLQTNPKNPVVLQVQALIAKIENRDSGTAGNGEMQLGADLVLAASEPSLPPSAWGPPGVDDVTPTVAAGVTCPAEQVLDMSGRRVKQFVDSMAQFSAVEDLVHEQLDPVGSPITKETRKFDYVASITEERPGFLAVDEYRNDRYGVPGLPDHIATTGFVTLALVFHPDMRDNFQITCEGLGQWRGQAAWLMRFQQREDKPNRLLNYMVGTEAYRVDQKGRAWINADNFQIVRIESELVNPVQRLSVQHQIAEYGPVHFQKKDIDLWLPQSADLFFEINRHRYHRRHSFDHYMLFSINSEEKPGAIKNGLNTSPVQNP
jgi:tetratricopeptide (TPR) repeat protein